MHNILGLADWAFRIRSLFGTLNYSSDSSRCFFVWKNPVSNRRLFSGQKFEFGQRYDLIMARVNDVAEYILQNSASPMSAMKLQKLCYYSQAWSLVWDDVPLFDQEFQAWKNGPVCPDLYSEHRGQFSVEAGGVNGRASALNRTQRETVDAVLKYYGKHSAQWLSDLTHAEDPWREARGDHEDGARCVNVISQAAMAEYYSALPPDTANSNSSL